MAVDDTPVTVRTVHATWSEYQLPSAT